MEFPINEYPFIRLYPEYLFTDAIINCNKTTDPCLATISISPFDRTQWSIYEINSKVDLSEHTIRMIRKGFDIESTKALSRPFSIISDCAEYHILQQQYTNRWDCVAFFADRNCTIDKINDYPQMSFVVGRYSSGDCFILSKGEYQWIGKPEKNAYQHFRFCLRNGYLSVEASTNLSEWIMLYRSKQQLFSLDDTVSTGCISCQENNQYFKWIANNYIQYKFNPEETAPANYIDLIKRDYKTYSIHPFIKFTEDKQDLIQSVYNGIWDYVLTKLRHGYYVHLYLNEYYIPNSDSYQEQYFLHENLFYGYNEDSKTVSIIHISLGKPVKREITKETLLQAYTGMSAVCMEFEPDCDPYELDIFHIYSRLSDYLDGRNSSEDHAYVSETEKGIFGIDIYQALLHDPTGRSVFLNDIRVSYMLYEHKQCMKQRFAYLYEMGIIPDSIYCTMKQELDELCRFAYKVMMLNIKNLRSDHANVIALIEQNLLKMQQTERKCYQRFLSLLDLF